MAVSKAITKCVPYVNSSSKVDKWDIEMTYTNDSEGDSTYYTSTFTTTVEQSENGFALKAKSSWSNADLVAICPVSHWDTVFASQVDSVITNTPDEAFSVPS
jgi:PhoPQ-activated pathogenicity-related protein